MYTLRLTHPPCWKKFTFRFFWDTSLKAICGTGCIQKVFMLVSQAEGYRSFSFLVIAIGEFSTPSATGDSQHRIKHIFIKIL